MRYKGTTLSLPEIARELNVEAILEGSAHLVGGRVRLRVQLIAARTDDTLWADSYDRQLEDVLDLQSELAARVAREIAVQLTPSEAMHLARRHEVNPEAHLEYLKSRHSAGALRVAEAEVHAFARSGPRDRSGICRSMVGMRAPGAPDGETKAAGCRRSHRRYASN